MGLVRSWASYWLCVKFAMSNKYSSLLFTPSAIIAFLTSIPLTFFYLMFFFHVHFPNETSFRILELFKNFATIITGCFIFLSLFLNKIYISSALKNLKKLSVNGEEVYVVNGYLKDEPVFYNGFVTVGLNSKIIITNTLLHEFPREKLIGIIIHEKAHITLKQIPLFIFSTIASAFAHQSLLWYCLLLLWDSSISVDLSGGVRGVLSLIIVFSSSALVFFLNKMMSKVMETEADNYAFSKIGSLYADTLNSLYSISSYQNSILARILLKLLDTHEPYDKRIKANRLDASSSYSFIRTVFPFAFLITIAITMTYLYFMRQVFLKSFFSVALFFIFSASILIGIVLFSILLYNILISAGFDFTSARLSIISYLVLSMIPYSMPIRNPYDSIMINIFALFFSIYVLRKEGILKAIVVWSIIFLIHILVSLTWLSLLGVC